MSAERAVLFIMEYNGRFYGKELIDWAIRDAETAHKGQIAVIVGDRFANKHPGDGDTLAPNFFIPATPAGEAAAKTFIIDGIGYDYWALPWERLEGIADMQETIVSVLADGEVVWAANEESEKRFYALRERLFRNLADPMYVCRVIAHHLENAMEIFKTMVFEENIALLRMGARFVGIYLGEAIAAANGTYLKKKEIGTDDPLPILRTLQKVPEGYIALQEKIVTAKDGETLITLCRGMIRAVRKFLAALLPETKPEPVYWNGWYEELVYTWRRIQYFCAHGDAANAFGWGGYLQDDIGMLGGLLTPQEQYILEDFDREDLGRFADRCEKTRGIIYERLKAGGTPIREYGTLEDFLAAEGPDA